MPLALTKPSEGSVGWASAVNQNWTDIENAINGRLAPKRYVEGLRVSYASGTTCKVSPGTCRNSLDNGDIALSSEVTVDIATAGANGLDEKTLSGTGSTNGTSTLTGSGTAFLTELGTRDITGTISSSSTTVTGNGSFFLSEVAVGDLIGNSAKGYYRVTAIASDTSLTIAATPGSAFSSEAAKVIENATVSAGSDKRVVNTITSNTSLTATKVFSNGGSGQTIKAGTKPDTASGDPWFAVWVVTGGSGTAGMLSTQRTTLLNPPTGYTSGARRVGWMRGSSGNFLETYQYGSGYDRDVVYEVAINTTLILSGGNVGSWTAINAATFVPPSARQVILLSRLFQPATDVAIYFRARGSGSSTTSRPLYHIGESNDDDTEYLVAYMDGAQQFEYVGGSGYAYVYLIGYRDTLS